jgi:hypothetical protein
VNFREETHFSVLQLEFGVQKFLASLNVGHKYQQLRQLHELSSKTDFLAIIEDRGELV